MYNNTNNNNNRYERPSNKDIRVGRERDTRKNSTGTALKFRSVKRFIGVDLRTT